MSTCFASRSAPVLLRAGDVRRTCALRICILPGEYGAEDVTIEQEDVYILFVAFPRNWIEHGDGASERPKRHESTTPRALQRARRDVHQRASEMASGTP